MARDERGFAGVVTEWHDCTLEPSRVVDRTVFVTREDSSGWVGIGWWLGIPATVGGGLTLGLAHELSGDTVTEVNDKGEEVSRNPRVEGYVIGGLLVAAGLPMLINSIAGAVQARDTVEHAGEVTIKDPPRRVKCGQGPAAGARVTLNLGGTEVAATTTDAEGRFALPLPGFELLLKHRRSRAELHVDGTLHEGVVVEAMPGVGEALAEHDARQRWLAEMRRQARQSASIEKGQTVWLGSALPHNGDVHRVLAMDADGKSRLMWRGDRLFLSVDSGYTWKELMGGLPAGTTIEDVATVEESSLAWVLLANGEIWQLDGEVWRLATRVEAGGRLFALQSSEGALLVSWVGGVVRAAQPGDWQWAALWDSANALDVRLHPGHGWVALLANGRLLASRDFVAWSEIAADVKVGFSVRGVWLVGGRHGWVFVLGADGLLRRRPRSGGEWTVLQLAGQPLSCLRVMLDPRQPLGLYVLGQRGIYLSLDGGDNFLQQDAGLDADQWGGWLGFVRNDLVYAGSRLYTMGRVSDLVRLQANLLFDSGQHRLTRDAKGVLLPMVERLLGSTLRARIDGHTDKHGSDAVNLKLSERRAEAVADFLVEQGVPRWRLSTRGFGEARPVGDNETEGGRQQNRRVEVVLVGPRA